ncbi:LADA_0F02498g1_1 [Lachancea dasiensis]|uniref:LADA_0F02498g1_1 n=1 Tax=Lachancea dasiensis TaxID=1072105 RepID=A0A1G4JIE5_9SACH|nr:LADA_0F02498g1_1 [Lachancea dasiensis]
MSLSLSLKPKGPLPPEQMFSLQVGTKLFQISGYSLNSDSPNLFTQYFSENDASSTLFIDRSPQVFNLIVDHLRGYTVNIQDETQFTFCFLDAVYFRLPRLQDLLKNSDYYYVCVGGRHFKLPKTLVSQTGNFPNYFEMTCSSLFDDVQAIYQTMNLARPPPQSPPYVNRSPEFFADLIGILRGGVLDLTPERRKSLIQECRYYRFLRLEQQLVPCQVKWNPILQVEEIVINLSDIKAKFVSLPQPEVSSPSADEPTAKKRRLAANCDWESVKYRRPFVDADITFARELIFQIANLEATLFFIKNSKTIHVAISGQTLSKFKMVFQRLLKEHNIEISTYMKRGSILVLPACLSLCSLQVNSVPCRNVSAMVEELQLTDQVLDFNNPSIIPQLVPGLKLDLTKSLWKLGVSEKKIMMIAVKADAVSGLKEYHKTLEYI